MQENNYNYDNIFRATSDPKSGGIKVEPIQLQLYAGRVYLQDIYSAINAYKGSELYNINLLFSSPKDEYWLNRYREEYKWGKLQVTVDTAQEIIYRKTKLRLLVNFIGFSRDIEIVCNAGMVSKSTIKALLNYNIFRQKFSHIAEKIFGDDKEIITEIIQNEVRNREISIRFADIIIRAYYGTVVNITYVHKHQKKTRNRKSSKKLQD